MASLNRTAKDAVYGLAVGDALGVPCEFRLRGEYRIDGMVGHGSHNMPAGTFSDDTSLTLATCDSLRVKGRIDVEDMRRRFSLWMDEGAYTADGIMFDIGNATANALVEGSGRTGFRENGNGSLMRIIPLAFVDGVTDAQIEEVSAITHAHEISRRGCVMYVRLAQDLLSGTPVRQAIAKLDAREPYERLRTIADAPLDDVSSSGYVVHTFEAALWALANTESYAECVLALANMGGDADTVAAVGGALAGIVHGYDAIPGEWIDALRGKDVIDAVLSPSREELFAKKRGGKRRRSSVVITAKNF